MTHKPACSSRTVWQTAQYMAKQLSYTFWQAVVPPLLTLIVYMLAHSTIMSCFSSKCAHGGHGSTIEHLLSPQVSALLSRPEPEPTGVLHFSRQMKVATLPVIYRKADKNKGRVQSCPPTQAMLQRQASWPPLLSTVLPLLPASPYHTDVL